MNNYTLAIHGGAGTIARTMITPELQEDYLVALQQALQAGERILAANGSACDAVEAAVQSLEDCPLFNAGRGSVFNHEGKHEMDACIMDGSTREAGAVCGVYGVRNPVTLARRVMKHSGHVLLSGAGAVAYAEKEGLEMQEDSWFYNASRHAQWMAMKDQEGYSLDHSSGEKKFGTVGAVALDRNGNLAAATSTGGMTNKRYGRIGDSPVIGAGTYANNATCAISCTGHGEYFLRSVVAYDISCLMEYKGLSLHDAASLVVMDKLKKIGGEGGLIAADSKGNLVLPYNSEGMYRGWVTEGVVPVTKIWE